MKRRFEAAPRSPLNIYEFTLCPFRNLTMARTSYHANVAAFYPAVEDEAAASLLGGGNDGNIAAAAAAGVSRRCPVAPGQRGEATLRDRPNQGDQSVADETSSVAAAPPPPPEGAVCDSPAGEYSLVEAPTVLGRWSGAVKTAGGARDAGRVRSGRHATEVELLTQVDPADVAFTAGWNIGDIRFLSGATTAAALVTFHVNITPNTVVPTRPRAATSAAGALTTAGDGEDPENATTTLRPRRSSLQPWLVSALSNYSRGTACWNGPPRGAFTMFVCSQVPGAPFVVRENGKCHYEVMFGTPSACTADVLLRARTVLRAVQAEAQRVHRWAAMTLPTTGGNLRA